MLYLNLKDKKVCLVGLLISNVRNKLICIVCVGAKSLLFSNTYNNSDQAVKDQIHKFVTFKKRLNKRADIKYEVNYYDVSTNNFITFTL